MAQAQRYGKDEYAMDKTESLSGAKPVFIGKIIEMELRRQERTVTWLSRKIHCDRRNAYNIFSRTSIDTELLYKLSIALNTDFFAYFSASLQHVVNQTSTPPASDTSIKRTDFFRENLFHTSVKYRITPAA